MTVTRPQLPLTGPISRADLQRLNDQVVAFEQTDKDIMVDEVKRQLSTGVAGANYFANSGLDLWTAGSSAVSCGVGVRQVRADSWWVRLASTTALLPTYERVASSVQAFLFAARIAGNTGAGVVDFGQEMPARKAAALTPYVTVSFTLANGTGAALVPSVRLDTCDSLENYSAVTNRASVAAASVASGATAALSVELDLSSPATAAALRNGALVYIRLPAGALDSAIKNVTIAALKAEIGRTPTAVVAEPVLEDPARIDVADREFLLNGDFYVDQWLTASATCPEDVDTYAAFGWWASPSDGSSLVYSREAAGPPNGLTLTAARLTGSVATTGTVDFGQNIPARNAIHLRRPATFSIWFWNGTGTALSPQIRIETPTNVDAFATVATQDIQTLPSCPDAAWTRISYSFNGANYAAVTNGLRVALRLPAGSLNSAGKIVRFAQAKLELGSLVGEFLPTPSLRVNEPPPGPSADLVIQAPTATTLRITATSAILDDGGISPRGRNLDLAINGAVNGAGGLDQGTLAADTAYHVWLIGGASGLAGLLSLSATAPLLPPGYPFRQLIGWTHYTASDFRRTIQLGRAVRYQRRPLWTGVRDFPAAATYYPGKTIAGAGAGYLLNFLGSNAIRLHGIAGTNSSTVRSIILAAASNSIAEMPFTLDSAGVDLMGGAFFNATAVSVLLLPNPADPEFFIRASAASISLRLELTGFDF